MTTLLSTTYFGPVQWYQKLYRAESVLIEQWESFQKQTYRNRCVIATTQGVQALTVPVERSSSGLIKDVRISDHGNWRHLHWNALLSAYGESPFFEYYQDDIRPFFEKRWDYLLDFNEAIRQTVCALIDIQPQVNYTQTYLPESTLLPPPSTLHTPPSTLHTPPSTLHTPPSTLITSFRETITPKHPAEDADFVPRPYYQVYQQKYGFQANLSVLDLLFNMGPESIFYL